jgi:hypothetical protein
MTNIDNISGNFVFDMDEVLVDISPTQYNDIRMNWIRFSPWFKDLGSKTPKEVMGRPVFYMDEWLMKDEINSSPSEKKKATAVVREMFFRAFFSKDIYSRLKPTKFAEKTIMNKTFMEHKRVNRVYILTRCTGPEMVEYKNKFVKKWFNHPKVEMITVKLDEKKSEVLKRHGVNWNLFVDDEIKNIIDFSENFDLKGKEFLIPKTGYNSMPLILDILIKEKGGVYNYFPKEI